MLRIAICDDEKTYSELISLKIEKCVYDNLKIDYEIKSFSSTDEIMEYSLTQKIDILFLDIMVGEVNSVNWLVEHQHEFPKTQFIIMTGFPTETENLSEIDCCYFLLKSKMTDEQLLRAIKRSINNITKESPNVETVSYGKKNYTVDYQTIVYIETFNNNILLHFSDGNIITLYSTLKKFIKNLSPNFLQCHKSFVINMNYIQGYEPHCFIVSNDEKIPIPPKKYKSIISNYKNYILKL